MEELFSIIKKPVFGRPNLLRGDDTNKSIERCVMPQCFRDGFVDLFLYSGTPGRRLGWVDHAYMVVDNSAWAALSAGAALGRVLVGTANPESKAGDNDKWI